MHSIRQQRRPRLSPDCCWKGYSLPRAKRSSREDALIPAANPSAPEGIYNTARARVPKNKKTFAADENRAHLQLELEFRREIKNVRASQSTSWPRVMRGFGTQLSELARKDSSRTNNELAQKRYTYLRVPLSSKTKSRNPLSQAVTGTTLSCITCCVSFPYLSDASRSPRKK